MSGQIETYHKEIFNFLRTVTIKFEPFAYLMGQTYMDSHGIENPHGAWNPYYIHLTGNYTQEEIDNNKQMVVYTVEKELPEQIVFDLNTRSTNPKTSALYKIPNKEYTILEERYPEYVGLIRTIAYPTCSMEEALAAPNFALLGYDATLLEENERESIIACLKEFLKMVRTRWWIEEFTYEDMFAVTFWSMMWQMLPAVLLGQRFYNIKTVNVHSFHIWEYLTSKGLKDYRDVLTMNQSLWLYRNINYIMQNEGKHSSLMLLAQNLLGDAYVSLLYKDMYQNTNDFDTLKRTSVDFRSFNFVSGELEKTEQIPDLNPRLVKQGIEHQSGSEYEELLEENLSTHRYNILNTKFLEFKKDPVDYSDEDLFVSVLLDNTIKRLADDKLGFFASMFDPVNGVNLKISAGDMMLLMYYATLRSTGMTDFPLPEKYYASLCVPYTKPVSDDLYEILHYGDLNLRNWTYVDIPETVSMFSYIDTAFVNQSDYADWATLQFAAYRNILRCRDNSNKYWYHRMIDRVLNKISNGSNASCVEVDIGNTFGDYTSWDSFQANNTSIREIITTYDAMNEVDQLTAYKKLSLACWDALFNSDISVSGVTNARHLEKIYDSIRDLFIKLGSYNITYLENDRDRNEYIRFEDPDFIYNLYVDHHLHGLFDFILEEYQWSKTMRQSVKFSEFTMHTDLVRDTIRLFIWRKFYIEYYRSRKIVFKNTVTSLHENDIVQKRKIIKLNFKIHTGITRCLQQEV